MFPHTEFTFISFSFSNTKVFIFKRKSFQLITFLLFILLNFSSSTSKYFLMPINSSYFFPFHFQSAQIFKEMNIFIFSQISRHLRVYTNSLSKRVKIRNLNLKNMNRSTTDTFTSQSEIYNYLEEKIFTFIRFCYFWNGEIFLFFTLIWILFYTASQQYKNYILYFI